MSLPRGRAPTYILKKDFSGLPQGTFIRPVRKYHLPKHILEEIGPYFDESREVMCYTSKGFISIPLEIIEII